MRHLRILSAALLAAGIMATASAQGLRPEVGKPLQQAGELLKAGKAREALAKVREADGASGKTPAEQLWREGSLHAAIACGFSDTGGTVRISKQHPALALVPDDLLLDAVVFGGSSSMISRDS